MARHTDELQDGACKLLTVTGNVFSSCASWGETLELLSSRGMY